MTDNIIAFPPPTGGSATESAVQSIRTMLQMERDLPSTMSGVDGIEALTEAVVELAPRLTTDEALTLLGVGALLFRVTKGCPRAEDQDTTWPAGLVDHIRKMLPSLDEVTAAAPGSAGPMASVPAVYVHLLLSRIGHLEMAAELAETRTKAQISDLIGAFALDNPAGVA